METRMNPTQTQMAQSVAAAALVEQLAANGVDTVVCVPDSQQRSLLEALATDARFRLITAATEDEAVGIASGFYFGGRLAALSIQHSGLYACVNTLRGLGLDARVPLILLVGMLAREPDRAPEESASSMNRLARPLLDTLGIPHVLLDDPAEVEALGEGIRRALAERRPFALLIGQPTG